MRLKPKFKVGDKLIFIYPNLGNDPTPTEVHIYKVFAKTYWLKVFRHTAFCRAYPYRKIIHQKEFEKYAHEWDSPEGVYYRL